MKLEKLFKEIDADDDPYFLSFAPITTSFSNFHFNFLNPNVTTGDEARQNEEYKMTFAFYANRIVRDSKLFQLNNNETLQNAYATVLNKAILIESSISDDEKSAYLKAKAVLFINDNLDLTPEYTKYKDFATKFSQIGNQIAQIAISLSQDGADSTTLTQQKQDLEVQRNIISNDWLVSGNKDLIENALKVVSALNEKGIFKTTFSNEIVTFKEAMDTATTINSDMPYLPTFCLPQNIYQYDYSGWKKISMSSEEISALEGDAKSYLGEDLYNAYSGTEAGAVTKAEFEYLFVTVQRNWFKPDLVNSPFWKFRQGDNSIVSDGKDLNNGILPAYIDKFIFVRRIMQYLGPATGTSAPEINTPAPVTYKFAEIAKLKNFSAIKTIKPRAVMLSKFRMASASTGTFRPMVLQHINIASGPATRVTAEAAHNSVTARGAVTNLPKWKVVILTHIPGHFPIDPVNHPAVPFSLSFVFNDGGNNAVTGLDVDLTNTTTGTEYSSSTDNSGKTSFDNMTSGAYHLVISDNEIFEDFESTYNFSAAAATTITLQKRPIPKFDMWLFGAVNYQLNKLPVPLENSTYS